MFGRSCTVFDLVFSPIIFLHFFETSPTLPPPLFFEWVRTCRPRRDGGGGSLKKTKTETPRDLAGVYAAIFNSYQSGARQSGGGGSRK